MQVKEQTFYHVNEQLNWQKDNSYFIGEQFSTRYMDLMSRGFMVSPAGGDPLPLNAIAEGMGQYLQANQKAPFMPGDYHFDAAKTLTEMLPLLRTQLTLARELIFEEVRKEHFPDKFSRYKSIQLIPASKEALAFWLPKLKKPNAKIYKLEVAGKMHRNSIDFLEVNSFPAQFIRLTAYQYWLGNNGHEAANDECIFEGLVKVLEVIDAEKVK